MNIIVTGASRGIGFELAKNLVKRDNNNLVAIARNEARLNELKLICSKENSNAQLFPIPFDLLNVETNENELTKKIVNCFSSIDILINNAGFLTNKSFEKLTNTDILSTIKVNLYAPALLIKALLPYMNRGSHVVNISSMGGFQGSQKFPGLAVYSASKAGIASLTECLAEEYKEKGISFNCLALGATDTEMLHEAFPGYKAPFTAEGMADFIADFALNKGKFFNGKVIPVSISTP
jgi:3-oxoacyl-[acyl-carrier protein] reductase